MTPPPRPRRLLAVLIVVAVLGLVSGACSSTDDNDEAAPDTDVASGATDPTTQRQDERPDAVLEARACDPEEVGEVAEGVTPECHWLVVPANRSTGSVETYRLAVTVLRSPNPTPAADPLVYLSGGPGYDGGSPNYWSTSPYIAERDVIVYDQRGTGASEPDLNCPEMEQVVLDAFSAQGTYDEESSAIRGAVGACRERLEDDGVDLTAFSTIESAADLADLRVALDYDEWNLLGVSYGSRLAQETMRSYPEGIRSVILDSTYPMDRNSAGQIIEGGQRAFDQLAAGCAADDECATAHGDLTAALDAIVEQYDAEPYTSAIDLGPDNGGPLDIVITGADIVAGLFNAMYDTALIPALPAFATSLAAGEASLIDQVALEGIPFITTVSEGMALSTTCADASAQMEAMTDDDADLVADPGKWSSILTVLSPAMCAEWAYAEVDDAVLEPVESDIATLVLSGTYDPITPTPGAETVADGLTTAQFVVFDGTGHGVWSETECATSLALAFLANPGPVDAACAAEVGPPDFR